MSEIKPQVGDCVSCFGDLYEIFKKDGKDYLSCRYVMVGDRRSYQGAPSWGNLGDSPDIIIIERDGKPYKPKRVFEEGWYPAKSKIYSSRHCTEFVFIKIYDSGRIFVNGSHKLFDLPGDWHFDHFDWIGEKLPESIWEGSDE